MDVLSVTGRSLSGVEIAVLTILAVLCVGVAWRLIARMRGGETSDVSGLKMSHRAGEHPS